MGTTQEGYGVLRKKQMLNTYLTSSAGVLTRGITINQNCKFKYWFSKEKNQKGALCPLLTQAQTFVQHREMPFCGFLLCKSGMTG